MNTLLPRTSRVLVVLAIGMGACGGGGKGSQSYPDASTLDGGDHPSGAAGGAAGSTAGAATGGSGGGKIVFPGSGGSGTAAGGAAGNGVSPAAGSTVLLSGAALLMGPGVTCSSAPATTTPARDRWCGIFVPSGNQKIGLVVIDVTKALAGTVITCSTGDANCVPLNAAIDTTNSDATYSFYGQTLIYYDASTIYAWRPGWTAGRALIAHSATQPARCKGAPDGSPAALCLSSTNVLYAGPIDSQTGGTLPMIESLSNGSTGIGFSPDGKSLIWSVVSSASSPAETLKMQAFADATTRKTIATNISGWALSADATRWYWLSAPVTDSTTMITTGTLQTAPYPAGTAPAAVQGKVSQYVPYGTKGVVTLTTSAPSAAGADMNVVADVDNPTTSTALLEGTDVIFVGDVNAAGNILYATMAQQPDPQANNFLLDLRAIKADGMGKCTVAPTPVADPGAAFNQSGSAVEWVQVTVDASATVTAVAGHVTTLADCASHTFSSALYSYYDVSAGLVIQQNFDSTAQTADVVYATAGASGVPGTPVMVQPSAGGVIEPLFPSPGRVLFTVTGGSSAGVYASPALTGAPETAPLARPLASASLARRPTWDRLAAPRLAPSRFASGYSIPPLIAAPTPPARLLSTKGASSPVTPTQQLRGAAPARLLFRSAAAR